jgi:hypothetical protein
MNSSQKPQWLKTPQGTPNEWDGRCARCDCFTQAINLELVQKPFSADTHWVCKGGCAPSARYSKNDQLVLKLLREMIRNGELR